MIRINFPAVRALRKAMARSERLAKQIQGMTCDEQFDGGEWSASFHYRVIEEIEDDIKKKVASRFFMNHIALGLHDMEATYHEYELFSRARHHEHEWLREDNGTIECATCGKSIVVY